MINYQKYTTKIPATLVHAENNFVATNFKQSTNQV